MSDIKAERTAEQLKELIRWEKLQRLHKKIGCTLQDKQVKGLSRVDIPDKHAQHARAFGDPEDPKSWKGPWITITKPQEIAEVICEINAKQYHQAHSTPFGSGPLAHLIGRKGNSPAAQTLLNGTLPRDLPQNLMPETPVFYTPSLNQLQHPLGQALLQKRTLSRHLNTQ